MAFAGHSRDHPTRLRGGAEAIGKGPSHGGRIGGSHVRLGVLAGVDRKDLWQIPSLLGGTPPPSVTYISGQTFEHVTYIL